MSSFITDELVWAITREREEEARRVRPHTERRTAPDETNTPPTSRGGRIAWLGLQPSLKGH
jgi:hypothetical protein